MSVFFVADYPHPFPLSQWERGIKGERVANGKLLQELVQIISASAVRSYDPYGSYDLTATKALCFCQVVTPDGTGAVGSFDPTVAKMFHMSHDGDCCHERITYCQREQRENYYETHESFDTALASHPVVVL